MATRVWESAVIDAPVDAVWGALRPLDFAFNPNVENAVVEEKRSASEVGAVVRVTYKDQTVQRLKLTEISDAAYTLSWDLIESTPAIEVMSVAHTLRLRRVTTTAQTFIEWTSDFSKDASHNVIEDARFKQRDNFSFLAKAVQNKGRIIGGPAGVFNPAAAKAGVEKIFQQLQDLHKTVQGELNQEQTKAAVEQYLQLPTFQINWAIAGLDENQGRVLADETHNKLSAHHTRLLGASNLPKLFQA